MLVQLGSALLSADALPPLLHPGMEALTASIPFALAVVFADADAKTGFVLGDAGGGMERKADLAFWLDGRLSDLRPTVFNKAVNKLDSIL